VERAENRRHMRQVVRDEELAALTAGAISVLAAVFLE
jgi:hypothetical protein